MILAKSAALVAALALAPVPLVAQDTPVLARENGILVEDGYVQATGASAQTAAAYMRITNEADADDRLLEVRSDAAARVELHTTEVKDGVARMLPLEGVPVPGHATVVLESRGMHVMLMGLTSPLQDGGGLELALVFENAGTVPVRVPVHLGRVGDHEHMNMQD
jgi:periplasmic copper chaperone A